MIHVCYGLRDESGKYSKYAGTSIQSLLDNTQEEVTIHILHDSTLSNENRRKLSIIAYQHDQEIRFYDVDEFVPELIADANRRIPKILNSRFTIGAFYRTMIPEVLDVDKVIYIDGDIVVNLNINDLWKIDFDGKPLAAIPEYVTGLSVQTAMRIFNSCKSGVVDPQDYFNSGVLFMDLDQIRGGGGHLPYSSVA
ncbi:MAG: hypothetical protein IJ575_02950 [Selenomonadaceae bacterium]|nr:hypothetical protein [Selenomonadaceae bacterium]